MEQLFNDFLPAIIGVPVGVYCLLAPFFWPIPDAPERNEPEPEEKTYSRIPGATLPDWDEVVLGKTIEL